jgi:hypothetical protein
MKIRFLFITAAMIISQSVAAWAQRGMIGVHVGYMNPKDTKSGLVVGGNWGTSIDESVSIGLGFDVFHTSYNEETRVASETANGMTANTYMTEMEYNRTILPLMAEINVKIPMGRYMGYLIRGGLGYSFLWSNEKNYEKKSTETRNYNGFTWQAAFGLYYDVGSRSTFTIDLFYNNGEVSRDVKKSIEGLPVSERVNLSGIGVRMGVILTLR